MTRTNVYLAGPMEGEPEHGYPVFNEVEAYINAHGLTVYDGSDIRPEGLNVVNPARNFDGNPNLPRAQYFRQDLPQVALADIIVLLPGYAKSKGTDLEIRCGEETGAVFFEAYKTRSGWAFLQANLSELVRYEPKKDLNSLTDPGEIAAEIRSQWEQRPGNVSGEPVEPTLSGYYNRAVADSESAVREPVEPYDLDELTKEAIRQHNGAGVIPVVQPDGNDGFTVKDSGARQEYDSGMVRDTQAGKPDYTLLPLEFLERWAWHMTKGAVKYGRENWRLANSQEEYLRFRSSALRHCIQWIMGHRDEDHASAAAFNIAAAEYVLERLAEASPGMAAKE